MKYQVLHERLSSTVNQNFHNTPYIQMETELPLYLQPSLSDIMNKFNVLIIQHSNLLL